MVDAQNNVPETAESNNVVQDSTDALAVAFWVEQSVYAEFNRTRNGGGTQSWEDWAQGIIREMNRTFEQSAHPLAPRGALTRVRLDKITTVRDGTLFKLNSQHAPLESVTDVQWGFSTDEYLNCSAECYDSPSWVNHELMHYLYGQIDLYALDVQAGDVGVRDDTGKLIAGTPALPFVEWDVLRYFSRSYDLMHHPDERSILSDYTVYALNRDWPAGRRTSLRPWEEKFLQVPADSKLRVLGDDNHPIANVEVRLFQAVSGNGSSGPYSQWFDNTADISGVTDSQGLLSLGGRPFGDLRRYGTPAGVALVELRHPASGQVRYVWLELTDFNMASWLGETGVYVHDVRFSVGPLRLSVEPAQLSFVAVRGTSPAPQGIAVRVLGDGAPDWSVDEPGQPWLRTLPSSELNTQPQRHPVASGPLAFIIDSVGLPVGTYTDEVRVSGGQDLLRNSQTITVKLKVVDKPTEASFASIGSQDGHVRESTENGGRGAVVDTSGAQMYVGDDGQDRQYRTFLSFDTSALPDDAIITRVQLRMRYSGFAGTNMFRPTKTHGDLLVDIRKPYFGSSAALVAGDFQATASRSAVGALRGAPSPGWITVQLTGSYGPVNLAGTTQLRLRFAKDDDDDLRADYMRIFSGDGPSGPALIVDYLEP